MAIAAITGMCAAAAGLACFGIILNVVNLFEVPLAMNRVIERFVTKNSALAPLARFFIVLKKDGPVG